MELYQNPYRGQGLAPQSGLAEGEISSDASAVRALLAMCPTAKATPLVHCKKLANLLGVASIDVKDERSRMGLGSFKALGAAYAIAKRAAAVLGDNINDPAQVSTALKGTTFVTSSAGNHGLSVAAGARVFGASSCIYLSVHVPEGFADRLRAFGAGVVIEGDDYEASLAGAQKAAVDNGWQLMSDSTWEGCTEEGRDIMEGYLAMPAEIADELSEPPTHIFLQAGVGGLASAMAVHARQSWGDGPSICVVEPTAAQALIASVRAGGPVHAAGPVTNMGRLDCKEPSHLALKALARDADAFMLLDDDTVTAAIADLADEGLETSPSGGAGYAGLKAACAANALGIDAASRVLLVVSEGPQDD